MNNSPIPSGLLDHGWLWQLELVAVAAGCSVYVYILWEAFDLETSLLCMSWDTKGNTFPLNKHGKCIYLQSSTVSAVKVHTEQVWRWVSHIRLLQRKKFKFTILVSLDRADVNRICDNFFCGSKADCMWNEQWKGWCVGACPKNFTRLSVAPHYRQLLTPLASGDRYSLN